MIHLILLPSTFRSRRKDGNKGKDHVQKTRIREQFMMNNQESDTINSKLREQNR